MTPLESGWVVPETVKSTDKLDHPVAQHDQTILQRKMFTKKHNDEKSSHYVK